AHLFGFHGTRGGRQVQLRPDPGDGAPLRRTGTLSLPRALSAFTLPQAVGLIRRVCARSAGLAAARDIPQWFWTDHSGRGIPAGNGSASSPSPVVRPAWCG